MSKTPLYSRSPRNTRTPGNEPLAGAAAPVAPAPEAASTTGVNQSNTAAQARLPIPTPVWALAAALLAAALVLLALRWAPSQRLITQADIDTAVRESLEKNPLPSAYAQAYEAILPSVVRVTALMSDSDDGKDSPEERALGRSLGTGVVIIDNGTILTNLHVVSGAKKLACAVCQWARKRSGDDRRPARERPGRAQGPEPARRSGSRHHAVNTADLRPGDHVIAVGNPFGIGPSA